MKVLPEPVQEGQLECIVQSDRAGVDKSIHPALQPRTEKQPEIPARGHIQDLLKGTILPAIQNQELRQVLLTIGLAVLIILINQACPEIIRDQQQMKDHPEPLIQGLHKVAGAGVVVFTRKEVHLLQEALVVTGLHHAVQDQVIVLLQEAAVRREEHTAVRHAAADHHTAVVHQAVAGALPAAAAVHQEVHLVPDPGKKSGTNYLQGFIH